jgi:hypothetical protein
MYKNIFWFGMGYLFCKHGVPITREVIVRTTAKLKEEAAKREQ